MNLKNILTVAGVLTGSALLLPMGTQARETGTMACCRPPSSRAQALSGSGPAVPVKAEKGGVQKATVAIDGGYSPASLTVKAGRPVEITFVRKSASGCDGTLVIPDLKFQKSLKQGEKTVVKFTPKKTGNIAFQCGMAMYKGQITVR
jgi:plastocyanin